MPNGLFTPDLILEVAEAGEDSVITTQEFSNIIEVIAGVFMGVAIANIESIDGIEVE